jgi:hypothetical protein
MENVEQQMTELEHHYAVRDRRLPSEGTGMRPAAADRDNDCVPT